jgi:hypothetical protein
VVVPRGERTARPCTAGWRPRIRDLRRPCCWRMPGAGSASARDLCRPRGTPVECRVMPVALELGTWRAVLYSIEGPQFADCIRGARFWGIEQHDERAVLGTGEVVADRASIFESERPARWDRRLLALARSQGPLGSCRKSRGLGPTRHRGDTLISRAAARFRGRGRCRPPLRSIVRASSTRELTPSLWKMLRRWVSTVLMLRNSFPAISGFVRCERPLDLVDNQARDTCQAVDEDHARIRGAHLFAELDVEFRRNCSTEHDQVGRSCVEPCDDVAEVIGPVGVVAELA